MDVICLRAGAHLPVGTGLAHLWWRLKLLVDAVVLQVSVREKEPRAYQKLESLRPP